MTFAKSPTCWNGFLGYRANFMLHLVVCPLVLVVPILATTVFLVKVPKKHVGTAACRLDGCVLFASQVQNLMCRLCTTAGKTSFISAPQMATADFEFIRKILYRTSALADAVALGRDLISLALSRFGKPPRPLGPHRWHKQLGWFAIDLAMTSVHGPLCSLLRVRLNR